MQRSIILQEFEREIAVFFLNEFPAWRHTNRKNTRFLLNYMLKADKESLKGMTSFMFQMAIISSLR